MFGGKFYDGSNPLNSKIGGKSLAFKTSPKSLYVYNIKVLFIYKMKCIKGIFNGRLQTQ